MCVSGGGGGKGGGVSYKIHPPRFWENSGAQNCPSPARGKGGGCWTASHQATHPASQPPKQYTRYEQIFKVVLSVAPCV